MAEKRGEIDKARRDFLKFLASASIGVGIGSITGFSISSRASLPSGPLILSQRTRLPMEAFVYENDEGEVIAISSDGKVIDEGADAFASAVENADQVLVHGYIPIGVQSITLPEDPRRAKVILGTSQAVIEGRLKIIGGELNDTYGLFELKRIFQISDEASIEPAIEIHYPRRTMIEDIIIATSDINLPYHNLMPSSFPNPNTIGIRLNTQSGEQTILRNIIVSGFETAFDFNSVDHLIGESLESRFCSKTGFRVGEGFDINIKNPHSFNCGGDEIVMFSIVKPRNINMELVHDENCQSITCNTRITFDILSPDVYLGIDGVYISGSGEHILVRTNYRSWLRFIEIKRAWMSNTGSLIVQSNEGALNLGRYANVLGLHFPLYLVSRDYDTLPIVRGIKGWKGSIPSSLTTVLGFSTSDNNNKPGVFLVMLFVVNKNDVPTRTTLEVISGDEIRRVVKEVPPGIQDTLFIPYFYNGDGYKAFTVRIAGEPAEGVYAEVSAFWIRMQETLSLWPP